MSTVDYFNNLAKQTEGSLQTGRPFSFKSCLYEDIFNDVVKKISFNESDVVLDIGGGVGGITKYLSNICKQVVLADGAEDAIKIAKDNLKNYFNVLFYSVDINKELVFDDKQFDKIFCYSVVHYLTTPAELNVFIRKLLRLTKIGGQIFIGDIPMLDQYKAYLDERKKNKVVNFLLNVRYFIKKFLTNLVFKMKGIHTSQCSSVTYTKVFVTDVINGIEGVEYKFFKQNKNLPFSGSREDLLITKK